MFDFMFLNHVNIKKKKKETNLLNNFFLIKSTKLSNIIKFISWNGNQ